MSCKNNNDDDNSDKKIFKTEQWGSFVFFVAFNIFFEVIFWMVRCPSHFRTPFVFNEAKPQDASHT